LKPTLEQAKGEILEILSEHDKNKHSRRFVEKHLAGRYDSELVDMAIHSLVREFIVDLVIDYPQSNSEFDSGRPIWFLKSVTEKEHQELHDLSPIKLRLLQILQATSDDNFPGVVPVEEVRATLRAEGFPADDVQWVTVKDRVSRIRMTRNGELVICYVIIPEYEKTEEYLKRQEAQISRVVEKEIRDMKMDDI